jgi:hypothetical protein
VETLEAAFRSAAAYRTATSRCLKPWFVINVKRGRVSYFYFSLKYVD